MLTPRETQVLTMRADGLSNKEIARMLGIDASTVGSHSKHLRRKLGARDNAHAVAIAFRAGMLTAGRPEGTPRMSDLSVQWRRPAGCESNGCPEVAFTLSGRVMVRSTTTPHMIAVFEADEWEQLRTGNFGEES